MVRNADPTPLDRMPATVLPAPEFDRFATLAATVCNTPMAAVTLITGGYQWIKGAKGMRPDRVAAERSFCTHTIRAGQLLEIPDATHDARVKDNDFVTGDDHFRFYAGVPLTDGGGDPVGALCVIDTVPRPAGLTDEQRRALGMLAGQASLQLKLQQAIAERDRTAAELRTAVADLRWAASHDFMTGLGNRALFRQALGDITRAGAPMALLAIDVDHFKRVNDSFGHQAGDALLKEIAARLTASVRSTDLVVRVGGDEFAVIVRDLDRAEELDDLAARLLHAMREPVIHEGRSLECRITIGGAQSPRHARDPNDLVCLADAALGEAKARGRARYVSFEPGMLAERARHLAQIALAQDALGADSIVPFYQPKVDLADGSLQGLEALLRLVGPDGEVRLPEEIGAAFAEGELAQAIGARMLDRVLRDMQRWTAQGIDVGRVAVNLSATEIGDPTFADRLLAALAAHRIAPTQLEIEIIEDVLLDERAGAVLASVRSLSQAGIRIAFDDFGMGYAALAHLPNFPVDVLKIDRSFVRNLDLRANQAIVAAMLSMARDLSMEVVAEGVETVAQAAELLRLGCTLGQGFLYSEAVPAARAAELLRARRSLRRGRRPPALADRLLLASRAA
jgi:diguanylate cyclase (GGDEF)-like protein